MPEDLPIPVSKVPTDRMLIRLRWTDQDGLNWSKGELATQEQFAACVSRSAGQRLPNKHLPALTPGEIIWLREGVFTITAEWTLDPFSDFETIHIAPDFREELIRLGILPT